MTKRRQAPMTIPGPLSGITVLDLTRVLAGPYCTMVLHDLGARVIKVETPDGGDDSREIGPFVDDRSAYFMSLNRGKESIALNLKDKADRATMDRLLKRADVLVENFRPGTMERLGYGWEEVHEANPRLIYAAASGFGHSGPYRGKPAYDMVVQGMGGIMSVTGHPDGPPTRVGTSVGDITAGLFTAIGVNAALYHRAVTGEGMMIDVGMLDCQVAILENAIARYLATGTAPQPLGARHPSITPFEAYRTEDSHIIVAAGNDNLFVKLCAAIGRVDLAEDPRFETNPDRTTHVDVLKEEFEKTLSTEKTQHWLEVLEAVGVPCGPINDLAQALADPQIAARNMLVPMEGEEKSGFKAAGNPIKMSAFPDIVSHRRAPELDADRKHILEELEKEPEGPLDIRSDIILSQDKRT